MSSFRDAIHLFLRRAARARRRRTFRARVAQALAGLSLALVGALVVLPFAPAAREAVVAVLAVAVVAALAHVGSALALPTDPLATASWMRRGGDALGGRLADAVELGDELARDGRVATGSAQLAAAHVRSVGRSLEGRDPVGPARASIPKTRGRRAVAALALAALALVLLPRGRSLLFLGASAPGAPDVVTYGPIELTYRHPAYLRREARTEIGVGDVTAPVGTRVELRVRADRPLLAGSLVVEGGGSVPLAIDGDEAVGELVVLDDGSYRLELEGRTGVADPAPPRHLIRAVADQAPQVRLFSPASDVVLHPGESVDVHWRGTDDHGLAEVALRLDVDRATAAPGTAEDGGEPRRIVLETFDPPLASRSGVETLSLARLGLRPGDAADLWVEAADADVVSGPNVGTSRRVRVEVRSRQEVEEALETGQDVLAERLLESLAVHLVSAPSRVASPQELVEGYWAFDEKLDAALETFPLVLERLEGSEEPDWAAWDALQDMRSRLSSLSRTRRRRAEGHARLGRPVRLHEALSELQSSEEEELERSVLFFDMWEDRRSAVRALDEGSVLEASAQRIEQLLADAAEQEGELSTEAREQLAAAVAELEAALEEGSEAVRELARASPSGPSPLEQRAASQQVTGLARQLEEALAAGDVERARELARELAQAASSFGQMARSLADPTAPGDPELARRVAELRREIERMRSAQADLRDRTNALREDAREGMSEEDIQRIDEMFEELVQLTDEAIALEERGEAQLGQSEPLVEFFARVEERSALAGRVSELEREARASGGLGSLDAEDREELLAGRQRLTELMLADLVAGDEVDMLMRAAQASREQLGRLRQALAARDVSGARSPARFALSRLEILVDELERVADRRLAEHVGTFQASAARTAEVLSRLEDLERQARAAAEAALTGQQREQLGEMSAEQLGLERQVRRLLEDLRELAGDAPFLGEQVGSAVGEAAAAMREATHGLAEGEAGRASEQQGEALARLGEAAGELSGEQGGGGRGSRDGRRGTSFGDDVEIPDADAYRVPKEFREEILQALRESSPPPGYEQQVREYYRRLVE